MKRFLRVKDNGKGHPYKNIKWNFTWLDNWGIFLTNWKSNWILNSKHLFLGTFHSISKMLIGFFQVLGHDNDIPICIKPKIIIDNGYLATKMPTVTVHCTMNIYADIIHQPFTAASCFLRLRTSMPYEANRSFNFAEASS